ncbi:MAG: metallophosphoesterase [Bryobacteraceae bacterium]
MTIGLPRRAFLGLLGAGLWAQDLTLPVKSGSVRFAAIGDMGTGELPQYQVAERMFEFHQKFPFDFVIMLGDNIYGGKSPRDLQKKFELPYKPLLDAGVKFYAALGNHDDTNQRFYKPFNMEGRQYYSFQKGNAHFFVLDTNYLDPQQLQWLEKDLAAAKKTDWKICYFHHPLYSSAAFHSSSTELRVILEPLFQTYGVQVVFAGHQHIYERVKPQKGITYFTAGAAGELRAGDLRKTDLTAAGYDKDRSFLLVEISGDDLYFQAISRTGLTIDSGTIPKQGL